MLKRLLGLGLIVGCTASPDHKPVDPRASDPTYWIEQLRDDAHTDEAERAQVIGRYLDEAPPETKTALEEASDVFSPCNQRLRMAGALHRTGDYAGAIAAYKLLGDCGFSGSFLARRIGFATVQQQPDHYSDNDDVLEKYVSTLISIEPTLTGEEHDQLAYEISAVEMMIAEPEGERLYALIDRAQKLLSGSTDVADLEPELRTMVIVVNAGGLELGDPTLVAQAAQADYWLHRRFGYSVL